MGFWHEPTKRAFFFLFLLGNPAFLHAQDVVLPDVLIEDARDGLREATLSSSTIEAEDYQNRLVTVSDLLGEELGVHVTRYGGLSEFTSISIRGSNPNEVSFFLDGVPIQSARSGLVDVSGLLSDNISSIEIVRGATPFDTGVSSSAGAVFLSTPQPQEGLSLGAGLGYGSYDTIKGNAYVGVGKENFGFLFKFAYLGTDGDFSFLDDNGTPFNLADDARVKRSNNGSQTLYPILKFFVDLDELTRFEWTNHFVRKDAGVPGLSTNQSRTADIDTTFFLTSFKVSRDRFFADGLSLESLTSFLMQKSQYSDINGEIGLGGAQDNDDDTSQFAQDFSLRYNLKESQTFTFTGRYQLDWFRPENFLATPSKGGTSLRQGWSTAVTDEIRLLNDKLILSPSFLHSVIVNKINNDDPSFLTPATFRDDQTKQGIAAKMGVKGKPFDSLELTANVMRGFRFPTFQELFGDKGGVVGNPLLDEETSLNWDAGFLFFIPSKFLPRVIKEASLTSTYFEHRVDDLIQFEQNTGFARAENVGKAVVRGIETGLKMKVSKYFSFQTGYTFQSAKDAAANAGRYLPGRPRHEVDGKITATFKRGSVFSSFNWMDEMFLDPLNTRRISSRFLVNAGLSVMPFKKNPKITLSFEAKNLTDDQTVDVVGYPLPGRSFFGKVGWEW